MSLFFNGIKVKQDQPWARLLTNQDDINNIVENGVYRIDPGQGLPKNYNYYKWSYLFVKKYDDKDIKQVLFAGRDIFVRSLNLNATPPAFYRVIRDDELKALSDRVDKLSNKIGGVARTIYSLATARKAVA